MTAAPSVACHRHLRHVTCPGREPTNPIHQPTNLTLGLSVTDTRAGNRRFGPLRALRAHAKAAQRDKQVYCGKREGRLAAPGGSGQPRLSVAPR